MPHIRKSAYCFNCGTALDQHDNFCRHCGQENDDRNVSLGQLVLEYIDENIGIDSKLLRSIKPFFTYPGALTLAFLQNKRRLYVPPLRLYLVFSLLFFVTLSYYTTKDLDTDDGSDHNYNSLADLRREDSLNYVKESPRLIRMYDSLIHVGQLNKDTQSVNRYTKRKLKRLQGKFEFDSTIELNFGPNTFTFKRWDLLNKAKSDTALVLDQGWDVNWFTIRFIRQSRRLMVQDSGLVIATFMLENASSAAFLMVPLLALLFKLAYLRHRYTYVNHLVHILHIQAYVFAWSTLYILLKWISLPPGSPSQKGINFLSGDLPLWLDVIWTAMIIITNVYVWKSLKNVYGQNVWKTTLKYIFFFSMWLVAFVMLLILLTTLGYLFF